MDLIALNALDRANEACTRVDSLGDVLNFKGTKTSTSALPTSGNKKGDVWLVTEDNSEWVWIKDTATGSVSDWEGLGKVYSQVVANPTLAGTEADLTGLEVNGTKYKVFPPRNEIVPFVVEVPFVIEANLALNGMLQTLLPLAISSGTAQAGVKTISVGYEPEDVNNEIKNLYEKMASSPADTYLPLFQFQGNAYTIPLKVEENANNKYTMAANIAIQYVTNGQAMFISARISSDSSNTVKLYVYVSAPATVVDYDT